MSPNEQQTTPRQIEPTPEITKKLDEIFSFACDLLSQQGEESGTLEFHVTDERGRHVCMLFRVGEQGDLDG